MPAMIATHPGDRRALKSQGVATILVEQRVEAALNRRRPRPSWRMAERETVTPGALRADPGCCITMSGVGLRSGKRGRDHIVNNGDPRDRAPLCQPAAGAVEQLGIPSCIAANSGGADRPRPGPLPRPARQGGRARAASLLQGPDGHAGTSARFSAALHRRLPGAASRVGGGRTLCPRPRGRPPHIVFSVSKSITGAIAGILVDRGELDPDAPVTAYVPEAAGSAYADATVRHVLDMTVGIASSRTMSTLPATSPATASPSAGTRSQRGRPARRPPWLRRRAQPMAAAWRKLPLRLAQLRHARLDPGARRRQALRRADGPAAVAADGGRGRCRHHRRPAGRRARRRRPVRDPARPRPHRRDDAQGRQGRRPAGPAAPPGSTTSAQRRAARRGGRTPTRSSSCPPGAIAASGTSSATSMTPIAASASTANGSMSIRRPRW